MSDKNTANNLGNYFRKLRTDRKLSVEDLAKRVGHNRTTIYNIENGRSVKSDTMRRIATKGFGIAEDSPEFSALVALWVVQSGLSDEPNLKVAPIISRLEKNYSKRLSKDALNMAIILSTLKAADQVALLEALTEPVARDAIIAMAHHFNGN